MNTIGERIDYIRKELNYTYKELGELIDVSGDTLRMAVARNAVRPIYINGLVSKLNLNKNFILTGEGDFLKDSGRDLISVKKYLESTYKNNVVEEQSDNFNYRDSLINNLKEQVSSLTDMVSFLKERIVFLENELLSYKKSSN